MKILVADYGLNVWYGHLYDYEERLRALRDIGYDGLERLHAATEAEVLYTAALGRRLGMHFATCEGSNPAQSIRWTAALGKAYVWIESTAGDMDTFVRQATAQMEAAEAYGIRAAIHNHLGSAVETQAQLEAFLERCPQAGLILDIGHLAGAGGDPLAIIDRYLDRIVMVHLKDFEYLDRGNPAWWQRLRFCELGTGELGELTGQVICRLVDKGYDGYMAVEHDTHLRDPRIDLGNSRAFIRRYGV